MGGKIQNQNSADKIKNWFEDRFEKIDDYFNKKLENPDSFESKAVTALNKAFEKVKSEFLHPSTYTVFGVGALMFLLGAFLPPVLKAIFIGLLVVGGILLWLFPVKEDHVTFRFTIGGEKKTISF